jgi:hypothetical protein
MPTSLPFASVRVDGDKVVVQGTGTNELANSLVQKNGVTLSELGHTFGVVQPEDISISAVGSITITNAAFAAEVTKIINAQPAAAPEGGGGGDIFDINCGCGGSGPLSW